MSIYSELNTPISMVLVEDDEYYTCLLQKLASHQNDQLTSFSSGEQALENIEQFIESDFAILDCTLPGMSGIDLAINLGNKLSKEQMPQFVIMTGHLDEASIHSGYSVGAFDFLSKTMPANVLLHKLGLLLDNVRHRVQLLREANRFRELYQVTQELFHSSNNALLEIDEQLDIICANPAAQKLFSLNWKNFEPPTVYDLCSGFDIDGFTWHQAVKQSKDAFYREQQPKKYYFWKVLSDGVNHYLELQIYKTSRPNYFFIQIDDASEFLAQKTLRAGSSVDGLTGVANQVYFNTTTEQAILHLQEWSDSGRIQQSEPQIAIILIDISNFKAINTSYGHDVGDRILQKLSLKIRGAVKHNDLVARLSEDVFGVFCQEENYQALVKRLQKLAKRINDTVQVDKGRKKVEVNCNVGVATYPECGNTFKSLMESAKIALDVNKKEYSRTYSFYSGTLEEVSRFYADILRKLESADMDKEFHLVYQPQVDFKTGKMLSAEALIRWCHEGTNIPPNLFIPVAEESGFIAKLGEWILEHVAKDLILINNQLDANFSISINISSAQLKKPNLKPLVKKVHSLNTHLGLNLANLVLEVTEHSFLSFSGSVLKALRELRKHGVRLSLDDFGTGYSSLSYIHKLPLDELKIDKSFVGFIEKSKKTRQIVHHIVQLAKVLGLEVVAEGIETTEQAEKVLEIRCDKGQGFLYAKPQPLDPLLKLLTTQRKENG